MTTDELIGALRARAGSSDCTQCEYYNPDENTKLFSEAADRLESLKEENTFLKAMQRQMADGVHNIGAMVENALKKGGQ